MGREWKKNYFEFDAIPAEVVATGEHIQGKLANGNFLAVSANEKTGVITFKEYPLCDITFCGEKKTIDRLRDALHHYCDIQDIPIDFYRDVFEWLDEKEKENDKFSKYPKASDIVYIKTDANSAVIATKDDIQNSEHLDSSVTTIPNKYGTITPTSQEEDSDNDTYEKGYENGWADCLEQAKGNVKDWIYNKGFQDGVKQAEEKMEKRLEEEWAKGNDVGYEDGGDDMLMQMPHWKKVDEGSILGEGTRGCINGNIYCDGWYVTLNELEKKLPRDEGIIYCDRAHIDYVNEEEGIEKDESIAEGCDEWNKFYNKYKNKKK